MIDETSNLVSQRFGGDNRNFFDDPLVCVKVKGQCLFYGLCSNTTHIVVWKWLKGLEKEGLRFKILQKKEMSHLNISLAADKCLSLEGRSRNDS